MRFKRHHMSIKTVSLGRRHPPTTTEEMGSELTRGGLEGTEFLLVCLCVCAHPVWTSVRVVPFHDWERVFAWSNQRKMDRILTSPLWPSVSNNIDHRGEGAFKILSHPKHSLMAKEGFFKADDGHCVTSPTLGLNCSIAEDPDLFWEGSKRSMGARCHSLTSVDPRFTLYVRECMFMCVCVW